MDLSFRSTARGLTLLAVGVIGAGCDQDPGAALTSPAGPSRSAAEAPAPSGTVNVTVGGQPLVLWPYTGENFSGTGQDPINLIFTGKAAPLEIRAALRRLDGNRTAFGMPDVFPFNCTWSDAIGDIQTAYAEAEHWTGSAVQLECGSFGPIRFHLRLFRQGEMTIANAHFELLIPGTATHQVLSWELGEQLVTVDLIRTGLLGAAPSQTGGINAAPTFREIPVPIYNGLPAALRATIGGPAADVNSPVGISTNGSATVFVLAQSVAVEPDEDVEDFIVNYSQVIPKPFCTSGPNDFLLAQGPLHLRQEAGVSGGGNYRSFFVATGTLNLVPFDPVNGVPTGEPYTAEIYEEHEGLLSGGNLMARSVKLQREIPDAGPFRGTLDERLKVGNPSADQYVLLLDC